MNVSVIGKRVRWMGQGGMVVKKIYGIVKTSSNENCIVMDFFCGSGTTLCAAQELGRKWIGIDKSEQAIKIAKKRLSEIQNSLFSENKFDYIVLEENYVEEKIAVVM